MPPPILSLAPAATSPDVSSFINHDTALDSMATHPRLLKVLKPLLSSHAGITSLQTERQLCHMGSMASTSPMSRFDLPGLNLPLNWTPNADSYREKARGEGRDLIKTALNDVDIDDGYTA